jgi:hypothetical protein
VKIPLSPCLPAAPRLAAPAAAHGGIVPLAPLAGSSVSRGRAVTFRMHVSGPGTYHWQAYRIHCAGRDCRQEGPVVRFRVA